MNDSCYTSQWKEVVLNLKSTKSTIVEAVVAKNQVESKWGKERGKL